MALTRVRFGATAALAAAGVFLVVRALVGIDLPALPRLPFMPQGDGSRSTVAAERPKEAAPRRPAPPVRVAAPDRTPWPERPRLRRSPVPSVTVVRTAPTATPTVALPAPIPVEPPKIEPPKAEQPKIESPLPTVEPPQPQPVPQPEREPVLTLDPLPIEVATLEPPTLPALPALPTP